jgi:hypothetical protein
MATTARDQKQATTAGSNGHVDDPEAAERSLEDIEAAGGIGEADDGQLFVWEQGRKVSLGTIIARNIPVEHAFVFGGKRLKGTGGLMGFDEDMLIVARGLNGGVHLVPSYSDDEKVTRVVVEVHIKPKVIAPADSDQAEAMLAGVLDRRGWSKASA